MYMTELFLKHTKNCITNCNMIIVVIIVIIVISIIITPTFAQCIDCIITLQWRSDDFRAPLQTTYLGPWPNGYGDYFLLAGPWRDPGGPLQPRGPPRGRGACGALATLLSPWKLLPHIQPIFYYVFHFVDKQHVLCICWRALSVGIIPSPMLEERNHHDGRSDLWADGGWEMHRSRRWCGSTGGRSTLHRMFGGCVGCSGQEVLWKRLVWRQRDGFRPRSHNEAMLQRTVHVLESCVSMYRRFVLWCNRQKLWKWLLQVRKVKPCLYRDTKQEGIENAICHFLAILHSCSQNRQTVPPNHAVWILFIV